MCEKWLEILDISFFSQSELNKSEVSFFDGYDCIDAQDTSNLQISTVNIWFSLNVNLSPKAQVSLIFINISRTL